MANLPYKRERPRLKTARFVQAVQWTIVAIFLVLLIRYFIQNSHEFQFLKEIRMDYLLVVTFLNLSSLVLSCYRFFVMLIFISHPIPFYTVFKYFTLGRFMNLFVPYGGSVFRAVMFKKTDGVSYKRYIASNVSFDWLNLVFMTLLGVVVIGLFDPNLKIGSILLIPLFIGVLFLLLLAIPVAKRLQVLILRIFPAASFRRRWKEVGEMIEGVTCILRNRSIFFKNSIVISLIVFINTASLYLLFKSVGVKANLSVLLVYMVMLRIFQVIRIVPANLGIREFLLGFLSHSLGTGEAEGIAVSLMMRIVTLCVQGGTSAGILTIEKISRFLLRKKQP